MSGVQQPGCQLAACVRKGHYGLFVKCMGFASRKEAKRRNIDMTAAIGFGNRSFGQLLSREPQSFWARQGCAF
jgi:hypothetical protein